MQPRSWHFALLFGAMACSYESRVQEQSNCFGACLDASADVDLEGELAVSGALRGSLESARAGLVVHASVAKALSGFVQAMVDRHAGLPAGVSYAGNGLYVSHPNADTRVELRFYLPNDTSFGVAGALIDFNLFNEASYFASFGVETSVSVGLSGVSTELRFTFDAAGRGAELLGIAPTAKSPISVDVAAFSKQLSKVIIHADVVVAHESEQEVIGFTLVPAARAVGS